MNSIKSLIYQNAKQIRYLHHQIHLSIANRHRSAYDYELWQNACNEFHHNYDKLAFSSTDSDSIGEDGLYEALKNDNTYAIEYAICFIEIRPYFFRSGYIYQKLLRRLAYADMTDGQKDRYQTIKNDYKLYRQQKQNPI